MPGIGVIVSLRAQRNLGDPLLLERMRSILGEMGLPIATSRPDELPLAVRQLRDRQAEIICIAGGDGTVHLTVQEIFRAYGLPPIPLVLPLPSGTMNNIARATGYRGSPLQILRRLTNCYRLGRIEPGKELLTLRIDDKRGFIFGLGFPVRLLEEYYRGWGRGRLKAAWVFLNICWGVARRDQSCRHTFAWLDWEVTLDGVQLPLPRYNALFCATVKDLGCGLKPTYRGSEIPGHFHALASALEPHHIPSVLPKVVRGVGTGSEKVCDRPARHVHIRAQTPIPYFIDGEIYRDRQQITIEAGPPISIPSF